MTSTCTRVPALLAALALLATGAAGGAAVAAGKIKGKQIARNAIAGKHLRAGAVTGDKLAAGAVTGAKVAPDALTGAQVDEATLARVPDAAAVGGATMTTFSRRLLSTNGDPVPIATGPDWTRAIDCSSPSVLFSLEKTGTASLVIATTIRGGATPQVIDAATSLSQLGGDPDAFDYELTSLVPGTATTVVELTAARWTNAFGATEDCFFHGTVTTTP
jgi:hypothetical protein